MFCPVLVAIISIAQTSPQAGGPGPSALEARTTASAASGGHPHDANDPEVVQIEGVVIVGRRGATPFTPQTELGAVEIDALGASNVGEVISRIQRRLGFATPPTIIINGRRALNPSDFTRFPPDALVRVEVLPPEAGAVYGDHPSRRVLNIVLQSEFRSRDGLLRGARATSGGWSSLAADVSQSEIHENATRQFGVRFNQDTALYAEDRETYRRDNPGAWDGLTLRPSVELVAASFSSTGTIGDWSTSLNTTAEDQNTRFVSGMEGQAVETRQETQTFTSAGGLGGQVQGWAIRLGLDGNLAKVRQTGTADIRSRSLSAAASVGADRTLMDLPAGALRTNLSSRFSYAEAVSDAGAIQTRLATQNLDISGNLLIPLSRRQLAGDDRLARNWGDLSATLGARVRGLAGTSARGEGVNIGLDWAPTQKLRFNTLWSTSNDAAADQQRLAPIAYGAPIVVFDFRTGTSVEILPLRGGNPDLKPQRMRNFVVSVAAGPYTPWRMLGTMGFTSASSTDGVSSLPPLTPELEAAFPERFTRNVEGRLVSIDQRLINLDSTHSDSLSSSLNFNVPFSRTPSPHAGYLQFGITHTWQIKDRLTIRAGLPSMDRLAGDGGGVARHQISLQADGRYGQWGLNVAADWRSASRIRRDSGQDGPDDLRLGDFATVAMALSYVFEPIASARRSPSRSRRYDGLRLEAAVENLFDARPHARLGDGRAAPGYGRDDQDPLGRTVRVTLSKRF